MFCVSGALEGGCLSLASIGRHGVGKARAKHKIKRADRFVRNERVSVLRICRALIQCLSLGRDRVLVASDWTYIGCWSVLVSAVVAFGRAIPVYWSVINEQEVREGDAQLEHFRIMKCLFHGIDAVHVLDRGFAAGPFLRFLDKLSIKFVCRVARKIKFRPFGKVSFQKTGPVSHRARVFDFGAVEFTEEHLVPVRLVAIHDNMQVDSWFLATNLYREEAREIVRYYGRRFEIEEFFKDLKDLRRGFQFKGRVTTNADRFSRLFAIAAVGYLLMTAAGNIGERLGLHKAFQVNTRERRELAVWRIGLSLMKTGFLAPQEVLSAVPSMIQRIGVVSSA